MSAVGPPRRIGWLAIAIALVACGPAHDEVFKARDVHYRFPATAVVSMTTAPHRLIRVSPPGEPFDLVFDSRIDDQVDRKGHPKIFSINDGPLFAKTYRSTATGIVACRPGIAVMDCGMALSVGGEHWSMLFAPVHKPEAVAMAGRAMAYIAAHELDVNKSGTEPSPERPSAGN